MKVLSHVIFLEEYFVGSLDFPIINFVNEGITLMFAGLVIGITFGNNFFNNLLFGITLKSWLFAFTFTTGLAQYIWSSYKITKLSNLATCIRCNILIFYLVFVHLLVGFYSDNWLTALYPKVECYFFMFISSRIIISLMIAHVMDIPYIQFQRYPLMLITAQLGVFVFEKFFLIKKTAANQMIVAVAYSLICFLSFVYMVMYLYALMKNIAKILDVNILTISPKKDTKSQVKPFLIKLIS